MIDRRRERGAHGGEPPLEERLDEDPRLGAELLRFRPRGVGLLPEAEAERLARGGHVGGGEEALGVAVNHHQGAVFVGLQRLRRPVGALDLVGREVAEHAAEIVVRADGDDEADGGFEARIGGGEEREAAGEAEQQRGGAEVRSSQPAGRPDQKDEESDDDEEDDAAEATTWWTAERLAH